MSDHVPHNFRLQRDGSAGNWYCAYSLGRRTPRRSMGTTDKKLAEKRMQNFVAILTAPKVNGTPDSLLVTHLLNLYDKAKAGKVKSLKAHNHAMGILMPFYEGIHYQGKPLLRVDGAFKTACRRAGLPEYTPHILKHTRITLLLEKGVSPWDVAGATATSLRTIEKVYGKHVKNKLTAAVNAA